MGTVYKVSCKCGYSKILNLGYGLSSYNVDTVNGIFSEEELKEFNRNYSDGKVKIFSLHNVAASCERCGEIEEVSILNVELKNGDKFNLVSKCPVCNGQVTALNNKYICPKCHDDMDVEENGLWD